MVYNYPARPLEEMDDGGAFPPLGSHVNGGWWWMTAGTGMALLARAGHPRTFQFLGELFEDHDSRYTIDYYNEWGRTKAGNGRRRGGRICVRSRTWEPSGISSGRF